MRGRQQQSLLAWARRCTDAVLRTRIMIVIHSADGKSQVDIAQALGCSASTVYRVGRWREAGRDGLIDRRQNNGETKADDLYATCCYGFSVARRKTTAIAEPPGRRRCRDTGSVSARTSYRRTARTTTGSDVVCGESFMPT